MATRRYNQRTWTVGLHEGLELRGFPKNTDGVTIELSRVNWPGAPEDIVCVVTVAFSMDSGASWQTICRASFPGGEVPTRDSRGNATHSTVHVCWPEVGGKRKRGRDIRVSLDIKQELVSALRLATFSGT